MPLERPQIDKPDGDIPFELGVEDLVVGDGDEATKGRKVSVHYVGVAFSSGEEFDASWNRGRPFEFKLGKGQVIREELPPEEYLRASYYERWLWSTEQRLLRKGAIAPGEVDAWVDRLRAGEAPPTRNDPAQAERALASIREPSPLGAASESRF